MNIMISLSNTVLYLPKKHKRLFDLWKTVLHRHHLLVVSMRKDSKADKDIASKELARSLRIDAKVRDLLADRVSGLDDMYVHTVAGADNYHLFVTSRRPKGKPDVTIEFV